MKNENLSEHHKRLLAEWLEERYASYLCRVPDEGETERFVSLVYQDSITKDVSGTPDNIWASAYMAARYKALDFKKSLKDLAESIILGTIEKNLKKAASDESALSEGLSDYLKMRSAERGFDFEKYRDARRGRIIDELNAIPEPMRSMMPESERVVYWERLKEVNEMELANPYSKSAMNAWKRWLESGNVMNDIMALGAIREAIIEEQRFKLKTDDEKYGYARLVLRAWEHRRKAPEVLVMDELKDIHVKWEGVNIPTDEEFERVEKAIAAHPFPKPAGPGRTWRQCLIIAFLLSVVGCVVLACICLVSRLING